MKIAKYISLAVLILPIAAYARGLNSDGDELVSVVVCGALIFLPFTIIKTRSGYWKYCITSVLFSTFLLLKGNGGLGSWLLIVLFGIAAIASFLVAKNWNVPDDK